MHAEPVTISFAASPIDSLRAFEALSYTWGNPAAKHFVLCESKTIGVTCNLWSALRRLRHETEERVLWIDALCINQKDDAERSSQVALMNRIYRDAQVIVWLGDEDEHTWEALGLTHQIAKLADGEWNLHRATPSKQTHVDEMLSTHRLPPAKHPSWKYLEDIFWKPWFFRAWIIQEIVLAKTLTIMIGSFSVSWQIFELATEFVGKITQRQNHKTYIGDGLNIVTSPFTNLNELRVSLLQSRGASLANMLVLTNASRATLPVDKVYALQGLVSEAGAVPLMPDYSLTAEQVFMTVAQSLLHDSLDVLSQVAGPFLRQHTNLPTWVPDWSTSFRAKPFLHCRVPKPSFRACGNTTHSISFSSNGHKLVTKGILVDKIKTVGSPFLANKKGNKNRLLDYASKAIDHARPSLDILLWKDKLLFLGHFRKWEALVRSLRSYPTNESVNSAFARTLIADANINAENQSLSSIVNVEEVYNHFRYLLLQIIAEEFDIKVKWPGWDDVTVRATQHYITALEEAAWGRVFVTERGYMGLGPLSTFAGDDVAVLHGGKTPYILLSRDRDSAAFHLLGETFIHGLMEGEAFQEGVQAKVIELV
jgi:hypothetical protein